MGLHKPFDRHMITNQGAVKLSGGTINLAKGQFAIADMDAPPTKNGIRVLSDFSGVSKKRKIELKLGKPDISPSNSRFLDNFAFSSVPFKIEDIVKIKVDAPTGEGDKVDDFVVGYNGEDGTELTFENGDNETLEVTAHGGAMEFIGLQKAMATVRVLFDAPNTGTKNTTDTAAPEDEWTDQEVVEDAYNRIKEWTIVGNAKFTDYVDVTLVNSNNPATIPGTAQNFYEMILNDSGTLSELALVQAQYPELDIKREVLSGGKTKYITIGTALPAAYSVSLADLLKGCEDCPAGYTEIDQGFVYQIKLEDNETDESAAIEAAIPGATVGSAVKNDQEPGSGVGYYSIVTDDALTQAEIDTFVDANPSAIVTLVSEDVVALCTNATTTDTAWVAGETCSATTETYTIRLADDECGNSILEKVQAAYPELTITEVAGSEGGCSREYSTTVSTDLVCEECDAIYRELFESDAPHDYNLVSWSKAPKVYDGTAKMGIRFRAKRNILAPSENFRDDVASVYDAVKLSIAGGFPSMINENYRTGENGRFSVKLLERYKPVTHLGMHLRCYEDMSRTWFDNTWRHENNYAKFVYGEETLLEATTQYVDYAITIHKRRYAQYASGKVDEGKTYHIIAEFGKHQAVEDLINSLAVAAGVDQVQATSKA